MLLYKFFSGYARPTVFGMSIALLCLVPVAHAAVQGVRVGDADIVYKNGFVYTADGPRSRAQAFAIRDGKFVKIGTNDDMKELTGLDPTVVDLNGKKERIQD